MGRMTKLISATFSAFSSRIADVFNPTYREIRRLNYLPETIEIACTPVLDSRNATKSKASRKKRGF